MNYKIISRIFAIAIVVGILYVSMNIILPYYFPQTPRESGTHVYIGEIYNGKTENISSVAFDVSISRAIFKSDYITYSVFSIWDSNRSYDQLGVATINGEAFATYSYTEVVNGSIKYVFNPKWFPLGSGDYRAFINASNGFIHFTMDGKSFIARTGAKYLSLSKNEDLLNGSYAGTTVYEEIYNFKWKMIPVDFNFTDIEADQSPIVKWNLFLHNVSFNYSQYVFQFYNTINIYDSIPYFLKGYASSSLNNYIFKISDFDIHLYSGIKYSLMLTASNYTYYILNPYNDSIASSGSIDLHGNTWLNLTL